MFKLSCCSHSIEEMTNTYKPPIEIDNDVNCATWETSKPFVPEIHFCKVIKVYDGDTITIATKIHEMSPVYRFSVRLNGIDTPEIKTHSTTEKKLAIKAKEFLSGMILDKIVELKNISIEKYGRLMADVYFEGCSMNSLMIESGYAIEYNGGKKEIPDTWKDSVNS